MKPFLKPTVKRIELLQEGVNESFGRPAPVRMIERIIKAPPKARNSINLVAPVPGALRRDNAPRRGVRIPMSNSIKLEW